MESGLTDCTEVYQIYIKLRTKELHIYHWHQEVNQQQAFVDPN